MSSAKMKGLLKGLRYISQIFEEKEAEMQIGFPTDVKHVAHIGWDGSSNNDAPSWMNEYKSPTEFQSAPLSSPRDSREDINEIKWVSQDSGRGSRRTKSPAREHHELPNSSRRQSSTDSVTNESPKKKDSSSKSRQPRRHHLKDSCLKESSSGNDSPSRELPDLPKKSRRKKSKESVTRGGSSKIKSKGMTADRTH
ncbi:CRIB domain-containing protein RIC6-like isoform X2 [Henckelia pumila]|uniref:CRIB domain-containing protein RIC6-like isoform X2 n=1 Tax=Henckelia pumila TaxID=405737 RepID=UPI003C6E2E8E